MGSVGQSRDWTRPVSKPEERRLERDALRSLPVTHELQFQTFKICIVNAVYTVSSLLETHSLQPHYYTSLPLLIIVLLLCTIFDPYCILYII